MHKTLGTIAKKDVGQKQTKITDFLGICNLQHNREADDSNLKSSIVKKRKYLEEIIDENEKPNVVRSICGNSSSSQITKSTSHGYSPKKNQTPKNVTKHTPKKKCFSKSSRSPRKFNKFTPKKKNFSRSLKPPQECDLNVMDNIDSSSCSSIINMMKSQTTTPAKDFKNNSSNSKIKTKLQFSPQKLLGFVDVFENDENLSNHNENISNEELNLVLDASWEDILTPHEYNLDLSEFKCCKILLMTKYSNKLSITVESRSSDEKALCDLFDFWYNIKIEKGDTVYIIAKCNTSGSWYVDNNHGMVIYEPDMLLSATTVVGSIFCRRRAVLKEKFRGFESSNRYMLIGTIVHQLFQTAMKKGIQNEQQLREILKTIICSKQIIHSLYEASLRLEDIMKETDQYIFHIISFIKTYMSSKSKNYYENNVPLKKKWEGKIDSVEDIEDNIWCPTLGLKGKIDLNVMSQNRTVPIEVKTGKSSVSLEHRGQLILYLVMMKELGYSVTFGLLLYLREGTLHEITVTNHEKRDLILLRNELSYFLKRKPTMIDQSVGEIIDDSFSQCNTNCLKHAELPEPINHWACGSCPYNVICNTFLKFEEYEISNNKHLKEVDEQVSNYLKQSHMQYFIHWFNLLDLESDIKLNKKCSKEIYMVPPLTREKNGKCISFMHIIKTENDCDNYKTTFEKVSPTNVNLSNFGISEGNYVVVSTNTRPAIGTGLVVYINNKSITLMLDKDLLKKDSRGIYHLDSYDSDYTETFNMTSLATLLECTDRAKILRELIIDKKKPTFIKKLPNSLATNGVSILRKLNKIQRRAVLKAITAQDYLLIKGMPGTGKTDTVVSLIQLLFKLNKSVLITSHTNAAVDNVCLRLKNCGVNILRLGSKERIHPKLYSNSEHFCLENCKTVEEIESLYNSAQIIAVTCYGSSHSLLSKRRFDFCIVDESTQVLQCSLFRPLSAANKFILIGDPEQLSPLVKSKEALKLGLSESLFERLQTMDSVVTLNLNYRMNRVITALANSLAYEGQLLVANETVANANLHIPLFEEFLINYKDQLWLVNALDINITSSVCVLDTGPTWKYLYKVPWLPKFMSNEASALSREEKLCYSNPYETALVVTLVKVLLKSGVQNNMIGVMASYVAQVSQLSTFLKPLNVDINTVDQFQGQDKCIIIYSCTKSSPNKNYKNEFNILEDKRRLTVAITRAKHKLIIIGDVATLKAFTPFCKLFSSIEEKNFITLQDNKQGFNWDRILSLNNTNDFSF